MNARVSPRLRHLAATLCAAALLGCAGQAPPTRPAGVPAAPSTASEPLQENDALRAMERALERFEGLDDGEVADYSPEAAARDPAIFTIAVATVDGDVWSVGDDDAVFPLQSLSKIFTLALALEDRGPERVLEGVGVHATGLPFGSLAAFEIRATPLQNPMVSAGAIGATSLVAGGDARERWTRTQRFLSACAGARLKVRDHTFQAEMEERAGSLAKAYALKSLGLLHADAEETAERYLRTCSIGVDVRDLAVMGATLARGGVNPAMGERVMSDESARGVLSAMLTAGLYDDSGPWFFRVGLPTKSGVSGGVVAVAPGRMAIAAYSPKLDSYGNSVRACAAIAALAEEWDLHMIDALLANTPDAAATR